MYVIYTNDFTLALPHKDEVDKKIKDIQNEKSEITIKGYLHYFLGTIIDSSQYGFIHIK